MFAVRFVPDRGDCSARASSEHAGPQLGFGLVGKSIADTDGVLFESEHELGERTAKASAKLAGREWHRLTLGCRFLTFLQVASPALEPTPRPGFVSTQVTEARRYYLNLSPPPTREIVVVCGGCERVRPEYVVQREGFPFFAIEFVAEGEGTVRVNGKTHRLRPGVAFAYGPSVAHCIRSDPDRPMLKYYVDFAGAEAERLLAGSPLAGWQPIQTSPAREIGEIFEMLQRDGASNGPFAPQVCAALVSLLLMKLAERAVPGGTAGEPRALATYERVKAWIEQHFEEVRTVEEIATTCGLDVTYLCRLFQRFGHGTPYRLLTRLKMNRAAELLLDHGLLVKETAAELGFADAYHFSRSFKRVYGLAPERFLHQRQALGRDVEGRFSSAEVPPM